MIVADTGPLLRVKELEAQHLLTAFAPIVIPHLVALECARYGIDLSSRAYDVRVGSPSEVNLSVVLPQMQAGIIQPAEAEAIAWALQENADWLLTDDSRAAGVARGLGVEVHGSVGLVLRNAEFGLIEVSAASLLLRNLRASSLWVSEAVIRNAELILAKIGDQR